MMKSKQKIFGLTALLAVAAMFLSACGAAAPTEPTTDPNMIFTQVAETVMVSMTQTAQAMPPTSTPAPTNTPEPTLTPAPVFTPTTETTIPVGPTATVIIYGDAAKWNTQSPMDGKVFKANEEFVFHVCMGNVGTTDWTTKYYLVYTDGFNLCYKNKVYVGDTVKPAGKWCFDLSCKAPATAGTYTTYWFLKNADAAKVLNGEVYFTYKVE